MQLAIYGDSLLPMATYEDPSAASSSLEGPDRRLQRRRRRGDARLGGDRPVPHAEAIFRGAATARWGPDQSLSRSRELAAADGANAISYYFYDQIIEG